MYKRQVLGWLGGTSEFLLALMGESRWKSATKKFEVLLGKVGWISLDDEMGTEWAARLDYDGPGLFGLR